MRQKGSHVSERQTTEDLTTVRAIMEDVRTCMVTTTTDTGALHSHPMTTQEAQFDGDAWFILSRSSETARNAAAHPHVNVSYSGTSSWLSLTGTAELVDDVPKLKELWNPFVEAWFPEGAEDPDVTLLKVSGEEAHYWDSPGRVAMMVSMLRSSVTKDPPSTGESATVDLAGTSGEVRA